MPDIGLLLSAPSKLRAVPIGELPPVAAAETAAIAAHFTAPVEQGIAFPAGPVSASAAAARPAPPAPLVSQAAGPMPLELSAPPPIRMSDLLWLALALVIIIGTGLGIRDPWPADEPRFAVVARDMVATGEWLFPRVGNDLYADKPPLFFWMLSVCYSLTGSLKAAFLIPSFVAAGGVLFCIYDLGRRLVSREAGLAAGLVTVCTLQFITTYRGAQIDPVLGFFTTLALYAFLRHLLLGPAWGWYALGGFAAGLGVITKGVGFLPLLVLIPFFALRFGRWKNLAPVDGGTLGWRWWLAPAAMLAAICLWFVPMLLAVSTATPEYAAYRDEILFHQTVGRYASSWHHVKAWYYFVLETIPPLWLPWSLALVWLVPRFRDAWRERDARVWLPLCWVLLVVLFFSLSPGKRGIYVQPALPAFAIASLPFIGAVLERRAVQRASMVLGAAFFAVALAFVIASVAHARFATNLLSAANLGSTTAFVVYVVLCGAGLLYAWRRAPILGWPVAIGALAVVFSYFIAPAMNGDRSARDFVHDVLAQLKPGEDLALVAYKEQFLLYLDRPTTNFGHRRFMEGEQEAYDASAWLRAGEHRVLLVPADQIKPCFPTDATPAGRSSDEEWYLVRSADVNCAQKGIATRAIRYLSH
jgi:4-amino-4-deoxy-L-arabinose transferase-like glycosyltransferase